MKVAFVLGTSTGGTARHVRMLAGGCAARGVAAEVFGPAQTDRDFAFRVQAGFTPVEIADRPRVLRDLRAIAVSAPARRPCACTTSGRQAWIRRRSRAIARRSRSTRGRSAISTGVNPA